MGDEIRMSENKLQANGFVKTPEDWYELTNIISGNPETVIAAHMGWNLACKYHNEIMAEMKEKEESEKDK